MKAPIAVLAAAAFLGSTTLVTAFYAPTVTAPSNVQLVQDKMKDDKMKDDKMTKDDKMAKDSMSKDDKMKDDKMMKDDKTKK